MFENGLRHDPAFADLVFRWQRILEGEWTCICCRPDTQKAARRLRVAIRRVVDHDGKLPPVGGVLLAGDKLPKEVHTPRNEQAVQDQMHHLLHRKFMHSEPAIELAKNIIIAADEVEKGEQIARAIAARTRTGPLSLAEREAMTLYHSPGGSASLGGDLGPGGPERSSSEALSPASRRELTQIFTAARAAVNPTCSQEEGPSGSSIAGSESAERGQPPASSVAAARVLCPSQYTLPQNTAQKPSAEVIPQPTWEAEQASNPSRSVIVTSEIEPMLDAPGAHSGQLLDLRARNQYQSIQTFQVEGPVPTGPTSYAPGRAAIGAWENVQNIFSGRQAGLPGPPAPYLPADSEGDELLSLISLGRSETESRPPTPKSPRAKPQNFGKTPREKRELLDAAHKNLEINEVDLPIPPARAYALRDRLGKEYQTRLHRIEDEKRQSRRMKAEDTGAGRRGVSPEGVADYSSRRPLRRGAIPVQPSATATETSGQDRGAFPAQTSMPTGGTPGQGRASGLAPTVPSGRAAVPTLALPSLGGESSGGYRSERSQGRGSSGGHDSPHSRGAGIRSRVDDTPQPARKVPPGQVEGRKREIEEAIRTAQ
jgi:hypothetical protein